jgi:hypothetical protein
MTSASAYKADAPPGSGSVAWEAISGATSIRFRPGALTPICARSRNFGSVMLRRLVGLCLVAAVSALAPAAHASPPDESWMPGLYDNADFDDVILLVTDNVRMIDPSAVGSMRPVCFVVGRAMPLRAESPPSSGPSPARSRAPPATVPTPRLLDRVREAVRARHYSRRAEKAYIHWIKRYILFHDKGHPAEMGAAEVTAFLTSLTVHDKVAASTQNQGVNALRFLYREVPGVELPWLDEVVRAKRPRHLPVVLTRDEVRAVLQRLDGVPRLMAIMLYGAGLRLLECCRLRVNDVDFAANQILIRDGKGRKDRVHQTGQVSHLPSFVRHPLAGGESRHPDRPGTARPPGRQHNDDLYACAQPGTGRGPEPGRPNVPVMTSEAGNVGLAASAPMIPCDVSRYIEQNYASG